MNFEKKTPIGTNPYINKKSKENKREAKTTIFWPATIIITLIHTYIYFFGYAYFKAKMAYLGFANAQIQPSIGEIYFQAYIGFISCLSHISSNIVDKTIEQLEETYLYSISISLLISGIIIYRKEILFISNTKPINSIKTYFVENFINSKLIKMVSLASMMTILTSTIYPIIIGVFLIFFSLIGIYYYIPFQAGKNYANKILDEGICEKINTYAIKNKHIDCTNIVTKHKQYYYGQLVYADDSHYYFLIKKSRTTVESKTFSIDEISEYSNNIYIPQKPILNKNP